MYILLYKLLLLLCFVLELFITIYSSIQVVIIMNKVDDTTNIVLTHLIRAHIWTFDTHTHITYTYIVSYSLLLLLVLNA